LIVKGSTIIDEIILKRLNKNKECIRFYDIKEIGDHCEWVAIPLEKLKKDQE